MIRSPGADNVQLSSDFVSGAEALDCARKNDSKRWYTAGSADAGSAATRLTLRGVGLPFQFKPKFLLSRQERIFTIGSCFARNVEEVLAANGISVPTLSLEIQEDFYNTPVRKNAALNRYTPHAMLSEIEHLFSAAPTDIGFLPCGNDQYLYPFAALTRPNSLHNAEHLRRLITNTNQSLTDCDAVFITLGHTETWFDNELGIFLNGTPPPQLIARSKDRFCFTNVGFLDAFAAISRLLELIRAASLRPKKFILTVSPVPIQTTFTAADIIQANTHAKSTLRAVASELSRSHRDVDYFPSYEIVLNSDVRFAWMADRVHVRNPMVEHIMDVFQTAYLGNL